MERVHPLLRRKLIVWLVVIAAIFLLIAAAFVAPPAHEVHTSGSTPINARLVDSSPPLYNYQQIPPSQSLDSIRCQLWRLSQRPPSMSACPDSAALAATYFPNLTQRPTTLYFPWHRCSANFRGWDGFNVEYRPSSRSLVIHCYVAEPWFYRQPLMMGVLAQPPVTLLVVPIESISAGDISIVEDDRVERLVGDQSDEFRLGTATIGQSSPGSAPAGSPLSG